MVMFGAVASLPIVWSLVDVSMGMMAIVNLVAILLLSGIVIKLAKDLTVSLKQVRFQRLIAMISLSSNHS